MTAVLDASALLGFLQDEPGCDQVEAVLPEAVICSVNWAEAVQKSIFADRHFSRFVEIEGLSRLSKVLKIQDLIQAPFKLLQESRMNRDKGYPADAAS